MTLRSDLTNWIRTLRRRLSLTQGQLAADSGLWPCDWPGATSIRLQVPKEVVLPPPPVRKYAEAELQPAELQDIVDGLSDILKAAAGLNLRFILRMELADEAKLKAEQIAKLNEVLSKICSKLNLG